MHAASFRAFPKLALSITVYAVREKLPGPFSQLWRRAGRMVAPTDAEIAAMLADLRAAIGTDSALADTLRVSWQTLQAWKRTGKMDTAPKSLIWFTWASLLHPERCQDVFDLMTWGRFRKSKPRQTARTKPDEPDSPHPNI